MARAYQDDALARLQEVQRLHDACDDKPNFSLGVSHGFVPLPDNIGELLPPADFSRAPWAQHPAHPRVPTPDYPGVSSPDSPHYHPPPSAAELAALEEQGRREVQARLVSFPKGADGKIDWMAVPEVRAAHEQTMAVLKAQGVLPPVVEGEVKQEKQAFAPSANESASASTLMSAFTSTHAARADDR
ncbi:hypothetical protein JCM10207_006848 [Rhodosporidiobolus poonsookiae]